tara:strand:+ start:146425 stop:146889 length:465 start_codon:yes stop_codon:yes gene_type:complete
VDHSKKREAREFCFKYFFHLQLPVFKEMRVAMKEDNQEVLRENLAEFATSSDFSFESEVSKYVIGLISNTLSQYDETYEKIQTYLKNWKMERLSKVDQTILLLGFSELQMDGKEIYKVIINECIELAKKYGTAESPSFINGVLDSYAKKEINVS